MIGQPFTINFDLVTTLISSSQLEYISPGTRVVKVNEKTVYRDLELYIKVYRVNIINVTELIVSFYDGGEGISPGTLGCPLQLKQ